MFDKPASYFDVIFWCCLVIGNCAPNVISQYVFLAIAAALLVTNTYQS
jgi:hypothetical protein